MFAEHSPERPRRKRDHQTEFSFRIRPALPADLKVLAQITAERDNGKPADYLASLEKIQHRMNHPGDALILVAEPTGESEFDAQLTGFGKAVKFEGIDEPPSNIAPTGWYLCGVIVASDFRRLGIGLALTTARIEWLTEKTESVYYFANARNQVSIALHASVGFVELARDFQYPGVSFEGGKGILYRLDLTGR